MKYLASIVLFVAGVSLAPAFASAATTPAPIVAAYDSLYESDEPRTVAFMTNTSVDIFGIKITTKLKGLEYRDADGDAEGKITMNFAFPAPERRGGVQKMALTMEYKHMATDEELYYRFKKLPKEVPDSFAGMRANTWYKQDSDESVASLSGQNPLTDEVFVEANAKYPAIVFTEKRPTQKDLVYGYAVDGVMLERFLIEQARIKGDTLSPTSAGLLAALLETAEGTLTIEEKTSRLKRLSQKLGADGTLITSENIFSYGGKTDVKPPKKAVDQKVVQSLFEGPF